VRLSAANIAALPSHVARPSYHRTLRGDGIVHFGIGAFHRAHMAWYTDLAMAAGEMDWVITGVSLRSPDVAEQLNPQDGFYTLTEKSAGGEKTRVIGSVRQVLVATLDREAVIAALAAPETQIASFTVTEKGYCRDADGSLDTGLAGPDSFYAFVAQGLRRRHDAGLSGLTLLSCDNLAENGRQLRSLMTAYLRLHDSELLPWFETKCTCPSTMVDRIVPATTAQDLAQLAATIGLEDEGAVMTEPFSQWVIEDNFAGRRPAWEEHGAELVADVRPYETAKLRMLNGAHSALAYLGLARGYQYVHEAIADPLLSALIVDLMRSDAAPTLGIVPGLDLDTYADTLVNRFANSALPHRLIQIAMDGSQKIPQRWLEPLALNQAQGRHCPATLQALAAWVVHIRGAARPVDDPMAAHLTDLWESHGADGIVTALFGGAGLFSAAWTASMQDMDALNRHISDGIR
jgi:fructuronate reductase